jgi:inosine/xanthosine triphosphate pyrophosphatase family protein
MKINSSNSGKVAELKKYLGNVETTSVDLREPEADAVTVAVVKATSVDDFVLIDDASLDVEGADLGVNIKWRMSHLKDLVGKPALFRVTLAYRHGDQVKVFVGEVRGKISPPGAPAGFGFDAYFIPDGASVPLSVDKPDHLNPRALACQALIKDQPVGVFAPNNWVGPWQKD